MPISIPTSIDGVVIPGFGINGPLGKLYESASGKRDITNSSIGGSIPIWKFPQDLGTMPTRQHYIEFKIFDLDTAKIAENVGTTLNPALNAILNPGESVKKLGEITKGLKDDTLNTLNNAANAADAAGAQAVKYISGNPALSKQLTKLVGAIALYMPDTVNFQITHNYAQDSLVDSLGRAYTVGQMLSSLKDTAQSVSLQKFKDDIKASVAKLGSDPAVVNLLTSFNKSINTYGLRAAGYAINPQMQVLFHSTDFRNFTFDFIMTPSNKAEAAEIFDIIKTFKMASAPEIINSSSGGLSDGMFFRYPMVFEVALRSYNSYNPTGGSLLQTNDSGAGDYKMPQIGRCVLESLNIDYAPQGWVTYQDGYPVQTRMQLNFKEIEIIDRKKVKEGY